MKKFFLMAVCVMAGVLGGFAQQKKVWGEDFKAAKDTAYVKEVAETGDVTMLVEIEGMKAEELYRFCREWFATKYASYKDAVQLEDKESGKLIVNCDYPLYFKGLFRGDPITMDGVETFKLTCDFKDGRFRVKASEYEAKYKLYLDKFPRDMQLRNGVLTNDYTKALDASGKPELFALEYRMVLSGMIRSMKEYISKAGEDDDF